MLYLTCTTITSVYGVSRAKHWVSAYYGVSRAKDWVSVDCGTNRLLDQSLLKLYQQSIDFLEFERENPNQTNYGLERPTEVVGTP